MVKFATGALLAGIASLALSTIALAAAPVPSSITDGYNCQKATSASGAKFVSAKAKCVSKCMSAKWKALANTTADCLTPFADPAVNHCVTGADTPGKADGAEEKFTLAQTKKCDNATTGKTDSCPACYLAQSGDPDCATNSADNTGNIEGLVDVFGPIVFCDANTFGGLMDQTAAKLQEKCELSAAKELSKYSATWNKCYDKCIGDIVKGHANPGDCDTPTDVDTESTTVHGKACIAPAAGKAAANMDKKCDSISATPGCYAGFGGTSGMITLVDASAGGQIGKTYCGD